MSSYGKLRKMRYIFNIKTHAVLRFSLFTLALTTTALLGEDVQAREVALPAAAYNRSFNALKGNVTSFKRHPYLVKVQLNRHKFCPGAIVSKKWVVTTADCCAHTNASNIKILMERKYYKVHQAEEIVLHPGYKGTSNLYDYDYACIKIKTNFRWAKEVKPVKIPIRPPPKNTTMLVVGLATEMTVNGTHQDVVVLKGGMIWRPQPLCKITSVDPGISWTKRMACAYSRDRISLCNKDWGDLFVKDGILYGQFVGASANVLCTPRTSPVILSDMSAVAGWVRNVTGAKLQDDKDLLY